MDYVEFRNSRGLRLAGNMFAAESEAAVVLAHGLASDKSSEGRFERIGRALAEAGYNALAFDFAGCGESDDDTLTISNQIDDLTSAVVFLKSRGLNRLAFFGNSLGTLVCLRGWSPTVKTMILMGAVTGAIHYKWDQYLSPEQLRAWARIGYVTIPKSEGPRKTVIVSAELLKTFEEIRQAELLENVKCPVLIIHGDSDQEERQLLERSSTGLKYLPAQSRLEVIDGAAHGCRNHMERVIRLTLDWVADHL